MKALKVIFIAMGGLFALAGLGLLIGSLALGAAYATQRDSDGYFTSGTERLESNARAITTDQFDLLLDSGTPDWLVERLGDVRVRAEASSDVFIGIGPADKVEAYLDGVAHDQISSDTDPFRVEYRRTPGDREPGLPEQQDFWAAETSGAGQQTVAWNLQSGRWIAVLMNADGAPGVRADLELGARSELAGWGIGVLAVAALLCILTGAGFILGGAIGLNTTAPVGPIAEPQVQPVRIEGRLDEPLSRWLWLVKWLLAVPHFIVLAILWIAFALLTFVAGVAILFTGRYPRGIFAFNVGVLRWSWRVGYYSTSAIGTDRYPPFSLGAEPDYPATLEIAYPEQLSRGLVLVKWWLLAIPHYLVLAILTSAPVVAWNEWGVTGGASLAGLLVVFAGLVLLFRGRYPAGVYALVMGINRWCYRVLAYVGLMTDVYPPFRLDQGALEPSSGTAQ
jgi:hypothetical protein